MPLGLQALGDVKRHVFESKISETASDFALSKDLLRIGFVMDDAKTPLGTPFRIRGFDLYQGFLSADQQAMIVDDLRKTTRQAPLFSPETPYGKRMTVRMTSAGKYGWFSDQRGYRYVDRHPAGQRWPHIPQSVLQIWQALGPAGRLPDCCLINYYGEGARMGMHQDKDEADFSWPVISISLGDEGLFRIGNTARGGKTESVWLKSGDAVVMGGGARLQHHGVDRIRFQSSTLLPKGGRINLTLRVVD